MTSRARSGRPRATDQLGGVAETDTAPWLVVQDVRLQWATRGSPRAIGLASRSGGQECRAFFDRPGAVEVDDDVGRQLDMGAKHIALDLHVLVIPGQHLLGGTERVGPPSAFDRGLEPVALPSEVRSGFPVVDGV